MLKFQFFNNIETQKTEHNQIVININTHLLFQFVAFCSGKTVFDFQNVKLIVKEELSFQL